LFSGAQQLLLSTQLFRQRSDDAALSSSALYVWYMVYGIWYVGWGKASLSFLERDININLAPRRDVDATAKRNEHAYK